jgi:hypothetical protein
MARTWRQNDVARALNGHWTGTGYVRLLSFRREDEVSFGALVEGRIVDLGRHLPEFNSLRELLGAGALVRALDTAAEVSPEHRLDKVTRLPPVTDPARVLCVFDESRSDPINVNPKFMRGDGQTLPVPHEDAKPLAAGVAMILGPPGKAGDKRIAGVCLIAYLSPGAYATGPWLVTEDELDGADAFTLTVAVGEQTADVHLVDLRAATMQLAADADLAPGDLIGVLRYIPEEEARVGDAISVDCAVIGTLKNNVVSEDNGSQPGAR